MIRRLANLAHNLMAHPLLALTGDHPAAVWLHDHTASIAYPGRPIPPRPGAAIAQPMAIMTPEPREPVSCAPRQVVQVVIIQSSARHPPSPGGDA